MQHIKITTNFDITNTKITRNYKPGILPKTVNNVVIDTEEKWVKARQQQSNRETLIQVISLRTQPLNLKTYKFGSKWVVEFDVEHDDVYRDGDDPVGLLKKDLTHVPLLTGLDENKNLKPFIILDGKKANTKIEFNNF